MCTPSILLIFPAISEILGLVKKSSDCMERFLTHHSKHHRVQCFLLSLQKKEYRATWIRCWSQLVLYAFHLVSHFASVQRLLSYCGSIFLSSGSCPFCTQLRQRSCNIQYFHALLLKLLAQGTGIRHEVLNIIYQLPIFCN